MGSSATTCPLNMKKYFLQKQLILKKKNPERPLRGALNCHDHSLGREYKNMQIGGKS